MGLLLARRIKPKGPFSARSADSEHRFGHGKAEALAGLGQATFIAGSAVFLVLEATDRILHPQPLAATAVGLIVMGVAILATIALLSLQRYVIRRTQSTAIRADALHYATDLAMNTATKATVFRLFPRDNRPPRSRRCSHRTLELQFGQGR